MIDRICALLKVQRPAPNAGLLSVSGTVVPVDGTAGYQTGCLFQHTDGGSGTAVYINEGTATACDFNPTASSAAETLSGMADVGTALGYVAGKILVADGVDYEEVAVSGDATLTAAGLVTVGSFAAGPTSKAGAATPAVALRFGKTVTEGYEIKVYDEIVALTNAVTTNTTLAVPAGAVLLCAQANLNTLVVGDGSGDNLLARVGLGITGTVVKYGVSADLVKNHKIDTLPDYAVNAGETLALFAVKADGTSAATEKFVAGGLVRVRAVYAVPNSLDDAA